MGVVDRVHAIVRFELVIESQTKKTKAILEPDSDPLRLISLVIEETRAIERRELTRNIGPRCIMMRIDAIRCDHIPVRSMREEHIAEHGNTLPLRKISPAISC
jgi:hypothetical protein